LSVKAPGRLPRGAIQEGAERPGRCAARRSGPGQGRTPARGRGGAAEFWVRPPRLGKGGQQSTSAANLYDGLAPLRKGATNSRQLRHLPPNDDAAGVTGR